MNTITKPILLPLALLVFVLALATGCSDDEGFQDVSVTPVEQFYEPTNNRNVVLQSAGSMYFEWEKAQATDNSVVYYDVLFDKEGGNFSNPLYVVSSDNKGISSGATITHKTLNKVAKLAGFELGKVGTLTWTVRSSRGLNEALATQTRSISLIRINNVDDLEGAPLFITGEGSEDGQAVKPTGTIGEYEIYTELEAGKPYHFYSTAAGGQRMFTVDPDGKGFREVTTTPEGATVSETGVYRIRLDFEAAAVTIEKITRLDILVSWSQRRTEVPYAGKGVWQLKDYNVQLASNGNGGFDERYKLIFTINGNEEHWGQKGPHFDDRPPMNRPGYRDMAPTQDGQWGGSQFKFPNELTDGSNLNKYTVDLTVFLTADKNYTHEFTNIRP